MRLSILLIFALLARGSGQPGIFKPTSLLIVTHGNGALPNTASRPVSIHEVGPPYTSLATQLRRTITLPVAAAGAHLPCTLYSAGTHANSSYTTPYVGSLSRSSDGRFALLGCLGCGVGSTLATAGCPRVVARIAASGAVDTSTAVDGWAPGAAPLSVASADGSAYYVAGLGGVLYAQHGVRSSGLLLHALDRVALVYQVLLFAGQLFAVTTQASAVIGARGVVRIGGAAAPTSGSANAVTLLPGAGLAAQQPNAILAACSSATFMSPTSVVMTCDDSTGSQDVFTLTRASGTGADIVTGAPWSSLTKVVRWNGGGLVRCPQNGARAEGCGLGAAEGLQRAIIASFHPLPPIPPSSPHTHAHMQHLRREAALCCAATAAALACARATFLPLAALPQPPIFLTAWI
jgi:hypothetical protein